MSKSSNSDRRDFLLGRSLSRAIEARIDSTRSRQDSPASRPAPEVARDPDRRQQEYVEQYSKPAMACEFEWNFNLHQYSQSGPAAMAGFQLLDQLESQLTVYRDDSELSRLNVLAADQPVTVEPRLFELLMLGQQLYRQTGGAFDMTAGPLSQLWGFDRRRGQLPKPESIAAALQHVGSDQLQLDPEETAVRFGKPGLTINLGGIGKGYALDRVAALFCELGVSDFVLHGGQSSLVARGTSEVAPAAAKLPESSTTADPSEASNSNSPDGADGERRSGTAPAGWRIGITHPALPDVRLGEIPLRDQALGTSGTGKQGFYHRGKRYGHIIDPRTGWPTDHILSSTVIAPTGAMADALATAFFVMSVEDVEAYCQEHTEVGAILICAAGPHTSQVRLTTLNVRDFVLLQA